LEESLAALTDSRIRPRILTKTVTRAVLVMLLSRLGSLHALGQSKASPWWRGWLGQSLPSADSLGRIVALLDPDQLREVLHEQYVRLRRSKAVAPTAGGLTALILDGHELHSSYRRCCGGCLKRRIKTRIGYRTQYYHRIVVAMLATDPFVVWLDLEPLREGDDEIGAAVRLLQRVLQRYPRAFDLVAGDALYSDTRIYQMVLAHHKDVLTVLKRNTPSLLEDAQALCAITPPDRHCSERIDQMLWDLDELETWAEVGRPVRVVRSNEHKRVRRQVDRAHEDVLSEWTWVTTLSKGRAGTHAVVELGHARWAIENHGFNEAVTRWHFGHIYRHEPQAILVNCLLAMIAMNLFFAFYHRNLHPAFRRQSCPLHLSQLLAADLLQRPTRPP
jgi:hypothetical protein